MSEVIPLGWAHKKLGDVAVLTMGQSPASQTYNVEGIGLPFFQGKADFSSRKAIVRNWCSEPNKIAQAGSVLFSVRAPVGEVNIAPTDCCIGRGLAAIRAKDADQEFLFQYLCHSKSQFEAVSQGSTFEAINGNELKEFLFLYPPLLEQRKIATILSFVDNVIEKTRAQIEKLKDLKTGMMQELLTQGIGHTEFKDSPIGKIPKTWSMIKVQELLADTKYALRSGPFGSALLKSELVNSGIPLLGIDNVHVEELRSVFKRFVSNEKFQELRKYRVFPNDVMVTIMGTVGRCCVVPEDFGIALSSKHVWTLSLDKEKYFPELLCWQINFSDWVKKQFLNESQGGVMESISSSTLKSLMVPVPPIEEQKKIVDVHKILSKRIMRKSDQLRTLIDLKKALMQDLLTGKVRVKVDSPETVAA
ncbi:restriction endonuclease subunit S [Alcaligenes sp. NLF5-7]|uniref:restriction endonuclease subunit S n=1 Tax=Alcaligenes sp. NLF5-7 TaxID=2918755 RepID=UPI0020C4C020|nr:restriction endonuclease subunit S [Alcaligenes sp. NLF5-7]UTM02910.1 restriction endonuclease subunit S [Alcaligenes sp. NLF5-7]